MAQKLEVVAQLKHAQGDKFYVFFKNNMNSLVNIFPTCYKSFQLLEGEEGSIGCVKLCNYVLGGIPLVVKAKVEALDDDKRSLTLAAIEGDLLKLYKSFKVTLTVNVGKVDWCIEYEKAVTDAPTPDIYADLIINLSNLVENHLLQTN